jgi:hypothetical protein
MLNSLLSKRLQISYQSKILPLNLIGSDIMKKDIILNRSEDYLSKNFLKRMNSERKEIDLPKIQREIPENGLMQGKLNDIVYSMGIKAELNITRGYMQKKNLIIQYFPRNRQLSVDDKRIKEISKLIRYRLGKEGFDAIQKVVMKRENSCEFTW